MCNHGANVTLFIDARCLALMCICSLAPAFSLYDNKNNKKIYKPADVTNIIKFKSWIILFQK